MIELKTMFIARALELLKENGEINDFVEFAKEQAKKDGMDRDEFMNFLDSLKAEDEEESDFNWIKLCKKSCFGSCNGWRWLVEGRRIYS